LARCLAREVAAAQGLLRLEADISSGCFVL